MEQRKQVSMVTLRLASRLNSMVGLFRTKWRLLAIRGRMMETQSPIEITEVNWVG